MKYKLAHFFLPDPAKRKFWLPAALICKGLPLLVLLFNKPVNDIQGFLGGSMGDTPSYLNPIDSLISLGIYAPDFRMPGYGIAYLFFRLFAPKALAGNLIMLSQFVLAAVSVYLFALTVMMLIKSKKAFYISFYLLLISTYSNFYDAYLLTESFCSSALIFSVYYFVKWLESGKIKHIVFSGVFLTWVIFLRPVFLPFLGLFAYFILRRRTKLGTKQTITILVFAIPFILCDGAWVTRNYQLHKKFIPLTSSVQYPQLKNSFIIPLTDFVQSWGGCSGYTDNNSSLGWFGYYIAGTPKPIKYDSLPDNIYTTAFNKDSLIKIRELIQLIQNPETDTLKKYACNMEIIAKLGLYKNSVKSEKPVLYYVIAPLRLLGMFLYGSETKLYMKRGHVFKGFGVVIEYFYTFFYFTIMVTGIAGMIIMLLKGFRSNRILWLFALIPLYTIIIHPVVLRFGQNRYLMPAWAFLIACATYLIITVIQKWDSGTKAL